MPSTLSPELHAQFVAAERAFLAAVKTQASMAELTGLLAHVKPLGGQPLQFSQWLLQQALLRQYIRSN